MKNLLISLLFVLSPSFAVAQEGDERSNKSKSINSEMMSSSDSQTDIKLSESEKRLAKQWSLMDSDWVKYKIIMQGPRGIWSPGLDPITALGVSETDPVERKRYAEIWIKMESRRAELEFAFEVERQSASKRIFGDKLAVNNVAWVQEWERNQVAVIKQVALFMDDQCKEECQSMFEDLLSSIGDNSRLDIFFDDGATPETIGQWASFMNIPSSVVKSKKITLNFDEGKSAGLNVDLDALPQVRVIDLKTGEVTTTYKK